MLDRALFFRHYLLKIFCYNLSLLSSEIRLDYIGQYACSEIEFLDINLTKGSSLFSMLFIVPSTGRF